jgi:hypothetical protein
VSNSQIRRRRLTLPGDRRPTRACCCARGTAGFFTYGGRAIDVLRPCVGDVDPRDIAHALARICRFGGHVPGLAYSVAQHSVYVSLVCGAEHALVGLLHDAAEAYVGDVVRPLKNYLAGFAELEHRWAMAIGERFGLGGGLAQLPAQVQAADEATLCAELRDLFGQAQVGPELRITGPWDAPTAEDIFLSRLALLGGIDC